MLNRQAHQSHTVQILIPWHKPFPSGTASPSSSLHLRKPGFCGNQKDKGRVRCVPSTIKAIATTTTEQTTIVKAVVCVKLTVGGFLSNLGLSRGLDDIADMLGKSIQLELVSAELDPRTGLEKETIKGYAHPTSQEEDEVEYECNFVIPEGYGEIGAVLVENEHHKEMYLKQIVFHGFPPGGPVHVTCNSWVASKFDNPHKRIFFTNKSYLPSQTPDGLKRLREKELENLRGNGQGKRKTHERIYDYDVYNDIGDPDSSPTLKRPVLGGKQHPYPRRCRTGRPRSKTGPELWMPNFHSVTAGRGPTVIARRGNKHSVDKIYIYIYIL
ncbi:hypothetical protein ACSBR2_014128 [Camellia fascicularis]